MSTPMPNSGRPKYYSVAEAAWLLGVPPFDHQPGDQDRRDPDRPAALPAGRARLRAETTARRVGRR
jgi:hypothetical protein